MADSQPIKMTTDEVLHRTHKMCRQCREYLDLKRQVDVLKREMNMAFELICLLDPQQKAQMQLGNEPQFMTAAELYAMDEDLAVMTPYASDSDATSSTISDDHMDYDEIMAMDPMELDGLIDIGLSSSED